MILFKFTISQKVCPLLEMPYSILMNKSICKIQKFSHYFCNNANKIFLTISMKSRKKVFVVILFVIDWTSNKQNVRERNSDVFFNENQYKAEEGF